MSIARIKLVLAISAIFWCGISVGQTTREIEVKFDDHCFFSKNNWVSGAYKNEVTDSFSFVGLTAYILSEEVKTTLYYRVESDNHWSEWYAFQLFTEGLTEGRTTFEAPPATTNFSAIQFKSNRKISQPVVFRLYYALAKKKSAEALIQETKTSSCSCPQPLICTRNCWCPTGNCPKDSTPAYTSVNHVVVHHSAGFNSSNDYAAVVAYYWDFHVHTNGWDDIGYNWLIDPNGVVYEGRGDSVLGAHFSCMNTGTTGICVIGNYVSVSPTDSAIAKLIKLITWECCDKNIIPQGISYHASSQLMLENICGHRDGNSSTAPGSCQKGTECPGDSLYALLPMIRDSVASFTCLHGVGNNENAASSSLIKVFPNPADASLHLILKGNIERVSWQIMDANGRLIRRQSNTWDEHQEINIAHLPAGIYLLQLWVGERFYAQKFIKQ